MALVVLNIACPFSPLSLDVPGMAERLVAQIDAALVRAGHESIVMACEGSAVEGILLATPKLPDNRNQADLGRIYQQYRFTLEKFLEKWPIDLVHMHGADFYEYLPPPGIPVIITLHLPLRDYPERAFHWNRPQTFVHCASEGWNAFLATENWLGAREHSNEAQWPGAGSAEGCFAPESNAATGGENIGSSAISPAEKFVEMYGVIVNKVAPAETHPAPVATS
jgi:hypothetical protein